MTEPECAAPTNDELQQRLLRLERRVERERAARREAEQLLESKSLELFRANRTLQELADSLEVRVAERSAHIQSMEAQLRQSQKMEAVGLLAGGIAHDFNNLLMIIGGAAELLLDEAHEAERDQVLSDMRCAVERGRDLTSRLLSFSRREPVELVDIDTALTVRALEHLLRRLLTERIRLTLDLTGSLLVQMSRGSFDQILLNLAANARDAMPQGGTFTIRTSPRMLGAGEATALQLEPGDYVQVTVIDTGTGMSSETARKAFDPFFSTKPLGDGSGLGLANVYSIVRQSRGYVGIETTPGMGTTFTILLPCSGVPAGRASGRMPVTPPSLQLPGELLVVDDEPGVRRVTAALMRRCGVAVREAASGEEALTIIDRADPPVAMLITDVRMPGMNGFELAMAARERHPSLPMLLISGYVDDPQVQERIDGAGLPLLKKPFVPQALWSHVVQAMHDAGGGLTTNPDAHA
jgi:signal transduction histidine kinase/CheY-like chemotaxis protein